MTARVTSYDAAIDYLYGRINFERVTTDVNAQSFKLERMHALLRKMGDPQRAIPAVHVAGTKGKGSTCAMVASILRAAGIDAGLFTSPHLLHFEERFQLAGVQMTPAELVAHLNELLPLIEEMDAAGGDWPPTYFEIATALAWQFFRAGGAKIAVLEVGMGGRLDSTNVCDPLVTVITNISRDHTQILGATLAAIATEKAGILKWGVPLLTGVDHPEAWGAIEAKAGESSVPVWRLGDQIQVARTATGRCQVRTPGRLWDDLAVPLRGEHQTHNAALAVAVAEQLASQGHPIDEAAVRRGLAETSWPARIEVVAESPLTIVDAAHNWASLKALLNTLDTDFPPSRRVLVFAATREKDVGGLLRQLLPRFDSIILTQYQSNPRGVPVDDLALLIRGIGEYPVHRAESPAGAYALARRLSEPEDMIVITGSFFIVAEVRAAMEAKGARLDV